MNSSTNATIYTIVGIAPEIIQDSFHKVKDKFKLPSDNTNLKNHLILKDTAHFAIKKSFILKPNISEELLIDEIKSLNLGEKISIECSTLGEFTNTLYGTVLFARVDKNSELQKLHMTIKRQIDNFVDTKNLELEGSAYLPHLSIIYRSPADMGEDIKRYVEQNILPLNFDLDKIFLLKELNSIKDERLVLHTFNLV